MKFIIQTLLAIALLIFAISLHAQQPASAPDSINKLINEKMLINKAMVDSAFKRITIGMQSQKATMTVKEWEQYFDAFEYFRIVLYQVWLEENKKKKPK